MCCVVHQQSALENIVHPCSTVRQPVLQTRLQCQGWPSGVVLGRPGSGVDIFARLNPGVDILCFTTGFRPVNLRMSVATGPSIYRSFVTWQAFLAYICDYKPFSQFLEGWCCLMDPKPYMPYLEWGIDQIILRFLLHHCKFWRTSNQKMPKILKLTATEQLPLPRIERLSFPVMESSPAMGPKHFWDF